ncbi:MAG TPA: LPS export ABC transporter periplasmic protein LptC [Ohtaekwangia sp.]
MAKYLFVFLIALVFSSCGKQELKEPVEYTGPQREVENIEMFYLENQHVKVKLFADLVYEFANGDREFPKGIYLEFYQEGTNTLESTLKANHAFFSKEKNQWRGQGKVEVKNVAKKEQLNTEELFWTPATKKIFTEKFVTIRQQEDVIYGTGLNANQDLTDYIITNPYGDLEVSE